MPFLIGALLGASFACLLAASVNRGNARSLAYTLAAVGFMAAAIALGVDQLDGPR